jgi:hypothetical protein
MQRFLLLMRLIWCVIVLRLPTEAETPGPAEYQNNDYGVGTKQVSHGALPFVGRGRTNTDWTIMAASKLPSVGDHNVGEADKSTLFGFVINVSTYFDWQCVLNCYHRSSSSKCSRFL